MTGEHTNEAPTLALNSDCSPLQSCQVLVASAQTSSRCRMSEWWGRSAGKWAPQEESMRSRTPELPRPLKSTWLSPQSLSEIAGVQEFPLPSLFARILRCYLNTGCDIYSGFAKWHKPSNLPPSFLWATVLNIFPMPSCLDTPIFQVKNMISLLWLRGPNILY